MSADFLPYGRQEIDEQDITAVAAALREPIITDGPGVKAFEDAVAEYLGARHVIAVATGTAALHTAAHAIGLGPGDECLVPPMTFAATANCALYLGASPRFVDIDPATWNLDCAAAVAAVSSATKALIPVSFAGLPAAIDALRPAGLPIIEDACHALGGVRDGRPVGAPGGADITCFSLHPVKAMTTGEGGLVVTEDDDLARRMRAFRTHGIVRDGLDPEPWEGSWYYEMQELGFNYRITDFQCALGRSQLQKLDRWVARRGELAERYRAQLEGESRIELPPRAGDRDRHGYHLFVIRVRSGREARKLVFEGLRSAGIGVQVHYIPVYRLPHYRDVLGYSQDGCPRTEELYAGSISLPLYPAMTESDVDRVVSELTTLLDRHA
jgi:UDP-4-amino-4,6-dideoxy-N-acetyl-beta-L-altrosamine transaminase